MTTQPMVEYAYVPAVKYPSGARRSPARKHTEPRRESAANDPLRTRQWNHQAVRLDRARAAADFSEASAVTVAIVDSGIEEHHPDLEGVVTSYVNFLSTAEDDRDFKGHGTNVAGIVSAGINNAIGIAGICAARIMALKALPRTGGRWDAQAGTIERWRTRSGREFAC